jgi:hypothetical protein
MACRKIPSGVNPIAIWRLCTETWFLRKLNIRHAEWEDIMSRNFWKLVALLVIGTFAAYSFIVILLSSSDANTVSGLQNQGQAFLGARIILLVIGFLYYSGAGGSRRCTDLSENNIESWRPSRRTELPRCTAMSPRTPRENCPYYHYRAGTCRFRAMTGGDTSAGREYCSLQRPSYTECTVWAMNRR